MVQSVSGLCDLHIVCMPGWRKGVEAEQGGFRVSVGHRFGLVPPCCGSHAKWCIVSGAFMGCSASGGFSPLLCPFSKLGGGCGSGWGNKVLHISLHPDTEFYPYIFSKEGIRFGGVSLILCPNSPQASLRTNLSPFLGT